MFTCPSPFCTKEARKQKKAIWAYLWPLPTEPYTCPQPREPYPMTPTPWPLHHDPSPMTHDPWTRILVCMRLVGYKLCQAQAQLGKSSEAATRATEYRERWEHRSQEILAENGPARKFQCTNRSARKFEHESGYIKDLFINDICVVCNVCEMCVPRFLLRPSLSSMTLDWFLVLINILPTIFIQ